ncbi:MAG: PEP-CTERM sorting domain-containing protein [Phycisphaerales bacterium]|nr:PEP-CTERM sorting domain-containing protein [Phycisphaerales bacterium]
MKKALVSAIIVAAGAACSANAAILYTNAPNGSGNAYSSQNDTASGFGNFATCYGFFTAGAATWNVTDIHFVGAYFNPPQQGLITGFTVNIYGDAGNAPGALASSTFVPAGSFSETFVGMDPFGSPNYLYDMNLTPTIVTGDAWVSIVPDVGFPPQWGWSTGVDANPAHAGYQTFFGSTSRLPESLNLEITGDVVPAPASLGLVGLAGLIAGRRRR